jgi:hypothetical protein
MRYYCLILIIFACFSIHASCQTDTTITEEQWVEDLDFLEETIYKNHKQINHRISDEELKSKISSLRSRLDTLGAQQKLIEMIMIMSSVGDGHTTIKSYDIFTYFPIHVKWFGTDLRIVWTIDSLSEILGLKINSIDGTDISSIHKQLKVLSPKGENKYLLIQWGQQWVRNADVLHYFGISKSKSGISLRLEDQDGQLVNSWIPALTIKELKEKQWICAFDPLPLYMQNPGYSLKHELLPGALYLNFRSYPTKEGMKDEIKELTNTLSNHKDLSKLIIDLRNNGGGNFDIGRYMIDRLKRSAVLDNRNVFVITGRKTYSAAVVNALDFKKQFNALIVGEPPMQRPNGYSESYSFALPNSNIKASVSTEYYVFQNEDSDELILDKYFSPNFDLLKVGRDEIMEWILEQ